MSEAISERELRNDSAAVLRRVEAGESLTVTRHGEPVADLVPHRPWKRGRRWIPAEEREDLDDLIDDDHDPRGRPRHAC